MCHVPPHLKYGAAIPCEITDTFKYDVNLEKMKKCIAFTCIEYNLFSLITYC